jgi:DNA processing protein
MEPGTLQEQAALVALLRTRAEGVSWGQVTAAVLAAGSAREVWERGLPAGPAEMARPGDTAAVGDAAALSDMAAVGDAAALSDMAAVGDAAPAGDAARTGDPAALRAAASDVARWAYRGWRLLTVLDDGYPARVREAGPPPFLTDGPPPFLFATGPGHPGEPAVTVAGTRRASDEGLLMTGEVAAGLAARGLTVLAGLAAGTDAQAHRAALDAGGRTAAVLATGLGQVHPPGHRRLQAEIAARGLLLSQFWPDAPARKHHFPMSDATLAGCALAAVVIEAGERSGARAQAVAAAVWDRPVILTHAVAEGTDWGRKLSARPGVRKAATAREILSILDDLAAQHAWPSSLTPA